MTNHSGAVAVVTGASRGIGLGIAQRLVAEGARVVVTARRPEPLEQVARELGEDNAVAVAGHTSDEEHQQQAVATAVERFGAVDYLVNNTGINPVYGPMLDSVPDVARKVLDTNVVTAAAWVRTALAAGMGTPERPGAVVNVASIAAFGASPMTGWYGVSKAGLVHLTIELAVQLAPSVRVNAVAPGLVKTRFASAIYEGREEEIVAGYPLGRLGTPEDVAAAVSFLLSRDASWVTGQTLVLDGGSTLATGM